MLLHSTWYGTFLLERDGKGWREVAFRGAPKDPTTLASEVSLLSSGGVLARERELASQNEVKHVSEERLLPIAAGAALVLPYEIEVPTNMEKGYDTSLLIAANEVLSQAQAGQVPRDANVLSGVGGLTDIDSSLNLVTERLREWYSKYWPAASGLLDRREVLAVLSEDPAPSSVASRLKALTGSEFSTLEAPPEFKEDLSGISDLASLALSLWSAREGMERYLQTEMERTAPNLSEITGPIIGARLIHSAGGLERLARLPSSTVQVLGAEKTFFKFLKEGGKPPKHGVLFQHPWVHSLPQQKRGRMARSIAGAASLAARMDAFGASGVEQLKRKLERRYESIKGSEKKRSLGSGRQPPFREGWWADKGGRPGQDRHRGKRRWRKDAKGRPS